MHSPSQSFLLWNSCDTQSGPLYWGEIRGATNPDREIFTSLAWLAQCCLFRCLLLGAPTQLSKCLPVFPIATLSPFLSLPLSGWSLWLFCVCFCSFALFFLCVSPFLLRLNFFYLSWCKHTYAPVLVFILFNGNFFPFFFCTLESFPA